MMMAIWNLLDLYCMGEWVRMERSLHLQMPSFTMTLIDLFTMTLPPKLQNKSCCTNSVTVR